jgi:antibiotic biosynthesis monooxygenase (ABM) superfamily enzyme
MRVGFCVLILAAVAALLNWVVFPWVDGLLAPWQSVTVR